MPVVAPTNWTMWLRYSGGLSHLTTVLFLKRAGLEMTPVSYKGDYSFALFRLA